MANRRAIKGVLNNFLGTYTSRYSDLDGYWLFGFIVKDIDQMKIDLLNACFPENDTPITVAMQLAILKFAEQADKSGISPSWIREAYLEITKCAAPNGGYVNGWWSSGYELKFVAHAYTDLGKAYESSATKFVAPHNPKLEQRSCRHTPKAQEGRMDSKEALLEMLSGEATIL
jgi:hypothetical protein